MLVVVRFGTGLGAIIGAIKWSRYTRSLCFAPWHSSRYARSVFTPCSRAGASHAHSFARWCSLVASLAWGNLNISKGLPRQRATTHHVFAGALALSVLRSLTTALPPFRYFELGTLHFVSLI